MCLGVPVRVTGPGDTDDLVRVESDGVERSVNRMMIEGELAPGSWIVLHLGFAMERISEADALDALQLLRTLGDPDADPAAVEALLDPDGCRDVGPATPGS